jgi:hypothetical protein
MFRSFQSAFDESFVNDHFRRDVRQFALLPGFHLLSHWLKVSLHSINANRDAVDKRERLRVFREHGSERAWDYVSESGYLSGSFPEADILPGSRSAFRNQFGGEVLTDPTLAPAVGL